MLDKYWSWGNNTSWEACIESNKICNLENCPDTLNCCVTNCTGMPTTMGFILMFFIVLLILTSIFIFRLLKEQKTK